MITKDNELKIAIPSKGRLNEQAIDILKKSGLKFNISGRQLFASCSRTGVLIIFSHAQDIPTLVEKGVVDMGITGSDLVIEKKAHQVVEHLKLGFGKCHLSFATHKDRPFKTMHDLEGKILGTKFLSIAQQYLDQHQIKNVQILEINGAVEIMVLLNLVDAILDVVETGNSLREHDLVEKEVVLQAEAVLIGNDHPRNKELKQRIIRRIEGVLIAANYSMLEYNCPTNIIKNAITITPGYSSPTIQKTDSADWVAVKVMVEKSRVQTVMDQLEEIGCQAIIETEVIHCRL
jgi:ATP phosphoribosyltransferase